jgi:hypothetical protein
MVLSIVVSFGVKVAIMLSRADLGPGQHAD